MRSASRNLGSTTPPFDRANQELQNAFLDESLAQKEAEKIRFENGGPRNGVYEVLYYILLRLAFLDATRTRNSPGEPTGRQV